MLSKLQERSGESVSLHPRVADPGLTAARRHVELILARSSDILPLRAVEDNARAAWTTAFKKKEGRDPTREDIARFDDLFRAACTPDDFFYGFQPAIRVHLAVPVASSSKHRQVFPDLTSLLASTSSAPVFLLAGRRGAGKILSARKAFFDCIRGPMPLRDVPKSLAVEVPVDPPALAGYLPIWCTADRRTNTLERLLSASRGGPPEPVALKEAGDDHLHELIAAADGFEGAPPDDLKRWLRSAKRLLLIVDMEAAGPAERTVLAGAILAFLSSARDRDHKVILVSHSTSCEDPALASLKEAKLLGAYEVGLPDVDSAARFLRNSRQFEAKVMANMGLRPPLRDLVAEYTSLEGLISRHVTAGGCVLTFPLFLHWASQLTPGEMQTAVTTVDLHDRMAESQLRRYQARPGIPASLAAGPRGLERFLAALVRIALVIKSVGPKAVSAPAAAIEEALAAPESGKARDGRAGWWPSRPYWHDAPYFTARLAREEIEAVLRCPLLLGEADSVGFRHDSLLSYFCGAVALPFSAGPLAAEGRMQRPFPRDAAWFREVVYRMGENPRSWDLAAEFLGWALTTEQVLSFAEEVLVSRPMPGLSFLLLRALRARGAADRGSPVRGALEAAILLHGPYVHHHPERLFQECYNSLSASESGPGPCRDFAARLLARRDAQAGKWLRIELNASQAASSGDTPGHAKPITAVAFLDPDTIVSAGEDGSMRAWDVQTGRSKAIAGHKDAVTFLVALGAGVVASAGLDGAVKTWSPSADEVKDVTTHEGGVLSIAALSCGRVLSGGRDGVVRITDPAKGISKDFVGHQGGVRCVVALGDGRIASAGDDRTVRLWNPKTGRSSVVSEHTGDVQALAVFESTHIASAAADRTVKLWDLGTGKVKTMAEHEAAVLCLATAHGCRFASGDAQGRVRLWDPGTGDVKMLAVHSGPVRALLVLPDGRIVSASDDGTVKAWDPRRGEVKTMDRHAAPVRAISLLSDGRTVTGGDDRVLVLWDPNAEISSVLERRPEQVLAVSAFADGRVASGGADGAVRIWDPGTRRVSIVQTHAGWASSVAVLPNGSIASGGDDNAVAFWDAKTGGTRSMTEHTHKVWAVAGTPDGKVVSSGVDGLVKLWDARAGTVKTMARHTGAVWPIAALPDGRVASGGTDRTVRLWNPATGEVKVMDRHRGWIWSLAVLVDGRIASGSFDKTVKLWTPATGEVKSMEEHEGLVRSVAAAPGGRVVSGSFDGTVRLWDPATGEVKTVIQHAGPVLSVVALADGSIVSASDDTTVKAWDAATGQVLELLTEGGVIGLCAVPGRPMFAAGSSGGSMLLVALEPTSCPGA